MYHNNNAFRFVCSMFDAHLRRVLGHASKLAGHFVDTASRSKPALTRVPFLWQHELGQRLVQYRPAPKPCCFTHVKRAFYPSSSLSLSLSLSFSLFVQTLFMHAQGVNSVFGTDALACQC